MANLPAGWRLARVDELGTVERGRSRHRPRNDPILYGGPYPFVQTGDVKAAGLRLFRYSQTYSETGLAQSRLWPVGTLCITIAANICDTTILGVPACFPDSIVGFTPCEGASDAVFVKYAIDFAKQRFTNISRGATQDNLSIGKLLSQQLPIPPFEERRRIASILGAYDDLIEINRRRIALLEEMARRLFEEWFVHFRFPGSDDHEMITTSQGVRPSDWILGTADELIEFEPKTGVAKEGRKPFIPMDTLSTTNSLIGEIEWREGNSGAKFRNGDTLFARITPCLENGKTGLVRDLPNGSNGFGSTEFIVMRGREAGSAFCYLLARHAAFREHARKSMSGASGRQRARTESLRTFRLPLPPKPFLEEFERKAWPLLELSGLLGKANGRLASSRQLLLPRLISAELSVSASERELEAVA